MSQHASSVIALPPVEQSAPVAERPLPAPQVPAPQVPASRPFAQPEESRSGGARPLRPLDVAECALCGFAHPLGLMVADGGAACADVRWYCKDTRSCTERWVMAHAEAVRAEVTSGPGAGRAGNVHPLSAAS
jgi:hypothetical protein